MRDGFLKMAGLATIAVSFCIAVPAIAADPIYSDDSAGVGHYRQSYATRSTYAHVAGVECGDLLIKYKHPYEPRSEVVQVCHPPLKVDTRVAY